jgi:hypothetical protein
VIAANTPEAANLLAQTLRDKEIARLEGECEQLRGKRRGIETALVYREQKLNRLKSQRVLHAAPTPALLAAACCG